MSDPAILTRIESWVAEGLIDEETAARLRTAESARPDTARPSSTPAAGGLSFGSVFGPGLAIVEMFGYLGAGFLLAAWHAFVLTGGAYNDHAREVFDTLMPAIVFTLGGLWLRGRSPRMGRAAGVAFAVATAHLAAVVWAGARAVDSEAAFELVFVLSTVVAALAAVAFRRLHPALLTQASLVVALWALAAAVVAYAQHAFLPEVSYGDGGYESLWRDPAVMVAAALLSTVWWILAAVGVGAIGLGEASAARRARDAAAAAAARHRAALTRFGAGMIAVTGVASAVWMDNGYGRDGPVRAVPAVAGDGLLLLVSVVLVWLAIGGRSIYLYPAALGMLMALTDLNARYVAPEAGAGPALLLEGIILLGVGLVAERLRRRMSATPPTPAMLPPEPPAPPMPSTPAA